METKPKARPRKKGTAESKRGAELAKLAQENCELQKRLCDARNYLRGYATGFKEALRVASLSPSETVQLLRIFRAADKQGQDFMKRPPSVLEPLVPSFEAVSHG